MLSLSSPSITTPEILHSTAYTCRKNLFVNAAYFSFNKSHSSAVPNQNTFIPEYNQSEILSLYFTYGWLQRRTEYLGFIRFSFVYCCYLFKYFTSNMVSDNIIIYIFLPVASMLYSILIFIMCLMK